MKFLLQNNSISINIARLAMVLKVFLNHVVRYVASTPNTVPNSPEMPPPVSLRKLWVLLLQPAGRSSFQSLYDITNVERWSVFNVDMHMIFANHPFKYLNIFRITNLLHKVTTSSLDVPFQNFISIFCDPNYMGRKPRHRVATDSLFFTHKVKLAICVATESLALKAHSFN